MRSDRYRIALEGACDKRFSRFAGFAAGEAGGLSAMGGPSRDAASAIAIFHDVSIRKKNPVVDGWMIKIS
ncbi:hypothetical protein SB394_18810 [Burkholderia sp. BCCIQ04A]|uniref:Uncharacterized protein n=3 Tax=Burkholderia TaxID=32008 RepID=A0ABW7KVX8_9BURK|nr:MULTISPECIES: hypothetical protein [Burkholderia]MEB2504676.1 hypothetical protein [Burkholderia anthinoferrum]MEB2531221.1 hypothetical protein [Burkholderia anthinoferrum]MEB2565406.1 hypothetical protein [Burkholderia anthinoferrum]MEB2580488.1 hypothetical protein [Burkholderia anthinoferrum]MCA7970035.1 hypothetical protein [Burkholderia sp. AU39826]